MTRGKIERILLSGYKIYPAGEVTLVVSTTPDLLLTLQTSTDLNSWTTIATATPVTELWTFVHDATLATGPKRFYRAFLNP